MATELHVGTAGGNVQLTELHAGTAGGNVELTELWVGTAAGNKQIFARALAAVTGLTVTTLSASSLRTAWNAVAGAAGYKVERSPDGTTGWTEVQDTASLTWDDTGRADGTRYYYRVRAYLGTVYGGYSSVENGVTTILAPSLTSAARNSTTPESAGDLGFSDGGSVSETEIRIYVSTTGPSSGFSLWATTAANDTAETITGLPNASSVWVKLRNYNVAAGESADSSVLDFTTAPGTPDWAVGYPQDNASDDDGIYLKLAAEGGATSYDVYYRVGASMGGDPLGVGTLLGNFSVAQIVSASYLHATGQAHGTVMYYQARARDGVGPGPFGAEASAAVAVRLPGVPTIGTPTNVGATATIPWSAGSPDNETLYRLEEEYRTTPSGTFGGTVTFTNPADDLDATRTMVDGREYRWRVRAENAGGDSAYSAWSSTIAYTVTPGVPGAVNLAYDGTNPASELVLSWTAPSGTVDGYDIEIVAYSASFTGTPNFTAGAADTSKRLTGLSDDTRYKARIRATNVWGDNGSWSTDDNEWTAPAAPTAPSWRSGYPQDNASDDDGILLWVFAAGDGDSYDVYYKVGGTMGGAPLTNGTNLGNFSDAQIVAAAYNHATGQAHGTTLYYQVRARNSPSVGSPHGDAYGPFNTEASASVVVRLPGAPASVSASNVGGTATVSWSQTAPDNETQYRLLEYYRTSPTGSWVLSAEFTNPGNDTSVDRPIIEGRQWRWSVRAENSAGNSSYVDSNDLEYVDTPGTPSGVALDYDGTNPDSELVLSWTAPVAGGTFDGYEIEYVLYASSFTGTANDSSGVDTSERLTGLAGDSRYKARLRAVSSAWGTAGSWSTDDDAWTAPTTPGSCTWTSGWPKATGDDTLELKVGAATDADEYEFYGGGALLTTQASATYAWTGRSANTQYTGLKVRAKNNPTTGSPHSATYGGYTTEESRYTLVAVPQSFSATRDVAQCPLDRFDISWSNNNGDSVARSETMTLERDDGSGYAVVDSAVTAGTTSRDNVVGTATTTAFRLKYNSESTYAADTSVGPPCPE
ncbi:MAG TPA: fibronectin type III domain-containing protein [Desulfobacterales bacterium]|nr:fibronectin type III domain-containing protein [Desulfobacterales bacterium]